MTFKQFFTKTAIVVLLLWAISNTHAQSTKGNKIQLDSIKKWYSEIQSIGLQHCIKKSIFESSEFATGSEPLRYEQIVSKCAINAKYSVIKAEFKGHEWASNIYIYLRFNSVFFVFIQGANESYSYENRWYCDASENIIEERLMRHDERSSVPEIENKLYYNRNIRSHLSEDFVKINSILNHSTR